MEEQKIQAEKPIMEITIKANKNVIGMERELNRVNEFISKMNEEHSGNYTLHFRISFS